MSAAQLGERAMVLGSGIAGLLSAAELSSSFAEVRVVERDQEPTHTDPRPGLPQGNHFHALLPGGLDLVNRLFPGFDDSLVERGAVPTVAGRDFYFFQPQGKSYALASYVPEPRDGPIFYVQSRGLLEACIRERVQAIANVHIDYAVSARAPIWESGRVLGVVLEREGRTDEQRAELTVDATGRASRMLSWLPRMGFSTPDEAVIHCDFAYTSAFVRPRDFHAFEGSGFFVLPNPAGRQPLRGSSLIKMEGGLWLCACGGRFGDYPPRTWEEMQLWISESDDPQVAELLRDSEPVRPPAHYRFPTSCRRHYERLGAFPEGLIPIGDAICHYNPLYGQGMSAAARQARQLGELLCARAEESAGLEGLALDFLARAFEETRAPWLFAALSDFQNPLCKGDFPQEEQEAIEMLRFLGSVGRELPEALRLLNRVGALQAPLSELLEPEWIARKNAARDGQSS